MTFDFMLAFGAGIIVGIVLGVFALMIIGSGDELGEDELK
jgi:xanthosine utilization system XapX-like protein